MSLRVASAVKFDRGFGHFVYGRVWDFDGGIVLVRSPHGTEYRMGRFWVKQCDVEDLVKLREFERLAKVDGRDLYTGRATERS